MHAKPRGIIPLPLPTPLPVGPVNAYLIADDSLTLIDAGANTDEAWSALLRQLALHHVAPRDIERILLTHGHTDHVGLLARLMDSGRARAFAHPRVAASLEEGDVDDDEDPSFIHETCLAMGAPESDAKRYSEAMEHRHVAPSPVTGVIPLADGELFAPFVITYAPGHSPSDVLFVDTRRREAFTGDHLLEGKPPIPMIRRADDGTAYTRTLLEYRESLWKTRALDVFWCYPGHGGPIMNHRAVTDGILRRQEAKAHDVLALLKMKPRTPWDMATALFGPLSASRAFPCVSLAVGLLELLASEGRVTIKPDTSPPVYYPI